MEVDAVANSSSSWSERVEDLIESENTEAAISLLEALTSNLTVADHPTESTEPQLATALLELAKLYASKGLSLKADAARSRAAVVSNRCLSAQTPAMKSSSLNGFSTGESEEYRVSCGEDLARCTVARDASATDGDLESNVKSFQEDVADGASDDGTRMVVVLTLNLIHQGPNSNDWETIAERTPDELLPPQCIPGISKLSIEVSEDKVPKRRGRGTFSFRNHGLYSDGQSYEPCLYDQQDSNSEDNTVKNSAYGTRHVLVLDGFQPNTTTADLEKLFWNFNNHEFVIRWINDTVALAVFRTPSLALEACNSVHCAFSVRVLEDDDALLSSIPPRDLEPPRQRPHTSARTAQRLIAQSMGLKLPSSTFGARELRKQEEARRSRIITRQNLIEDAWGADDGK